MIGWAWLSSHLILLMASIPKCLMGTFSLIGPEQALLFFVVVVYFFGLYMPDIKVEIY